MSRPPDDPASLQPLLDRLAAGDEAAADDVIAHAMDRLRLLTRRLVRDRPAVRRWELTDDVLQNAALRLHRALKAVRPADPRHFVNLEATQVRRELSDLFRRHYGPHGDAAHHRSDPAAGGGRTAAHARGMSSAGTRSANSRQNRAISSRSAAGWPSSPAWAAAVR